MPSQGYFTSKVAKTPSLFESMHHKTNKLSENWVLSDKQTSFFSKRHLMMQRNQATSVQQASSRRCNTVEHSPDIRMTMHERIQLRTNLLRKDQDPTILHSRNKKEAKSLASRTHGPQNISILEDRKRAMYM